MYKKEYSIDSAFDEYGVEFSKSLGKLPYFTAGRNIRVYENKIIIDCGANVKFGEPPPKREFEDIKSFSDNSRRRLLKKISAIPIRKYGTPFFVTTTFHNEYPENNKPLKIILDNFLKKIKRMNKDYEYFWRLEFQKRGAPHFHFIIFPPFEMSNNERDQFTRMIKTKWHSYLIDLSPASIRHSVAVLDVDQKKKLFSYLAKYTSKTDGIESPDYKGRRWGHSANLKFIPLKIFRITHQFNELLRKYLFQEINKKGNVSDEFIKYVFNENTIELYTEYQETMNLLLEIEKKTNSPPIDITKEFLENYTDA